jgi:DNA repair protein RadA/Sms
VRPVGQTEQRLKEARKLGFTAALMPEDKKTTSEAGLSVQRIPDLAALVGDIFGAG